mmetsp:Transcript_16483/g.38671  ORF Transcript_16483/g.38671 Transcript_16483/m.38671 type:complete len:1448 (+) Transcript_16483:37-4380(+)
MHARDKDFKMEADSERLTRSAAPTSFSFSPKLRPTPKEMDDEATGAAGTWSGSLQSWPLNAGFKVRASLPSTPAMNGMVRSVSTPNGPRVALPAMEALSLRRSASAEALFRPHSMDTKEVHALLKELSYHTDLSRRQMHELCERLQVQDSRSPHAVDFREVEDSEPGSELGTDKEEALQSILAEYRLPTEPGQLRHELSRRLRRQSLEAPEFRLSTAKTPSSASSMPTTPNTRSSPSNAKHRQSVSSRSALRLQIFNFLQVPHNCIRVVALWHHEAESHPSVQQYGSWLDGRANDKSYKRVYTAFEAMFRNMLDENDAPLREVLFDFVSKGIRRMGNANEERTKPPQLDSTKRAVSFFSNAVLAIKFPEHHSGSADVRLERSQWIDSLSRVMSQFERALEETWTRLSPEADGSVGAGIRLEDETISAMESLRRTLVQNAENADLLYSASRHISSSAAALDREASKQPENFWGAYLRQAITVSKEFLQLARSMTLLAGLSGQEAEHLSDTVLRQEYKRIRRAVADMMLKRAREIEESWYKRISKELPEYGKHIKLKGDRPLRRIGRGGLLSAVIEWWRTGHSGMLRSHCMDIVAQHFEQTDATKDGAHIGLQLEQVQAILPIFEEVVLESLHREFTVRAGSELSEADEPRVCDILAHLTHELSEHLDSEWHIAEMARGSCDILPASELFQTPNWSAAMPFDYASVKTAFLGVEIQDRFVVTRHVNRGAMGRVWIVEDRFQSHEFPICLKTFYCEHECEDMSHLSKREFKRGVLEELSQVERWLTSRTRLAVSQHFVRVLRVFRGTNAYRPANDSYGKVEGVINGILMEYCDRGELTSYLWDERASMPWSFDEPVAQYFFVQIMDCMVELFGLHAGADGELIGTDEIRGLVMSFSNQSEEDLMLGKEGSGISRTVSERVGASSDGADISPMSSPMAPTKSGLMSVKSSPHLGHLPHRETSAASVPPSPAPPDGLGITRDASVNSQAGAGKMGVIKYFHNDIKMENLVISGTTVKLIDFQSLMPLHSSRSGGHVHIEHATPVYRHRQPAALSENLESKAEGNALWACGVILLRMLAADLPSTWVYEHRGLGNLDEFVDALGDEDHCLLQDRKGAYDLLQQIFSPERTPSVKEVLKHPWVKKGREMYKKMETTEAVQQALDERRPEGSNATSAYVGWVPLTGCIIQDPSNPPVRRVEEIIEVAISLSRGHFRSDGVRKRPRYRARANSSVSEANSPKNLITALNAERTTFHGPVGPTDSLGTIDSGGGEVEELHEWHIIVCMDEGDDGEELQLPGVDPHTPSRSTGAQTPLLSPSIAASPMSHHEGAPSPKLRRNLWAHLKQRLILDRFCLQVRIRSNPEGGSSDEPSGIWWIRVKWLPPMVGNKKRDTLASFSSGRTDFHPIACSNFVRLQQLLLEARSEVQRREQRARMNERARNSTSGTLLLPGFGGR